MESSTTSQCSDGTRRSTVPVPSTWPWTMCPPSRVWAVTARSRFPLPPGSRTPREVLSRVSRMISAVNVSPSRCATVRQQPLTETESPGRASSVTRGPRTVRRIASPWSSSASTTPSSSTIPVNNSRPPGGSHGSHGSYGSHCQSHVGLRAGSERAHVGHVEEQRVGDRFDAQSPDTPEAGSEQHRRDVRDDLVHEPLGHKARRQGRPALEEHVLAVPSEQVGEGGLRVPRTKHCGLRRVVAHPTVRGYVAQPHDRTEGL